MDSVFTPLETGEFQPKYGVDRQKRIHYMPAGISLNRVCMCGRKEWGSMHGSCEKAEVAHNVHVAGQETCYLPILPAVVTVSGYQTHTHTHTH